MDKLTKAREQISVLQKNAQLFDIQECLNMSSAIRNNLIADTDIEEACLNDANLSKDRKEVLDQIQSYQHNVISQITDCSTILIEKESANISDFCSANEQLHTIASEELKQGVTSKNSMISEFQEAKDHNETLKYIANRGANSTYTILIMGEYQTGKTTFVDSLIGKHIGAIGDGNTTSAVPLTISYGEDTKIDIEWKTDIQILSALNNLTKFIDGFDIDLFDISDEHSREDLLKKIDDFRHHETCPSAKEPGCKVLAICSILLKYYNSNYLQSIKTHEMSTVRIAEISRFPDKLESRWHKRGSSTFNVEESVFAFISRINCFVPSERLKSLDCTFVDSPGLFSNVYDTQVTEREMINADAILYLLPYYSEMGQDTTGSLYRINSNYEFVHRKLFIVNNWNYQDNKKFFQNNCDTIRDMFGDEMNVYRIDAKLAYLGELKKSFDNNLLSEEEIRSFIKKSEYTFSNDEQIKFENFTEAWDVHIYNYKRNFKWNQISPSAEEVIEKSGINNVVSQLRQFVETNEAYSIVYANGIAKMAKGLQRTKKALQIKYIEPYLKGKFELERLWEERMDRTTQFIEVASPIISKHFFDSINGTPSLYHRLADMVYGHVFSEEAINNLIVAICKEIYNCKWSLAKCGNNETKIKKLIAPKIQSVVTKEIAYNIGRWNDLIMSKQAHNYETAFKAQIQILKNELKEKWNEIYNGDETFQESMNRYYTISDDTSIHTLVSDTNQGHGMSTNKISVATSIMGEIASLVAIIVLLITPTVISIATAIATNPIGLVVGVTVAVTGSFYWLVSGEDILENKFISLNGPKIKDLFKEQNVSQEFKSFIETEILRLLKGHQQSMLINGDLLNNDRDVSLSTPSEEIEENCFKAAEILSSINAQIDEYNNFIQTYISCPI